MPRRGVAAAAFAGALAGTGPSLAADEGKALFTGGAVPACAICHTLKDAGATGAVGPVLDDLKPDAARVVSVLKTGVGAMPSYQATLTEAQIQAIARYVSTASGGAK